MVACYPGEFDTGIRQFGQFAQEADVAPRHNKLVLVPVVEDVAQQIEFGGIVTNGVEKAAHAPLLLQRVGHVFSAQVQVRDEICVLASQCV